MQLTVEIMRKGRSQYVDSIASLSPGRNVVHLDLGLEFSGQPLPGTTTMIQADDLAALSLLLVMITR